LCTERDNLVAQLDELRKENNKMTTKLQTSDNVEQIKQAREKQREI